MKSKTTKLKAKKPKELASDDLRWKCNPDVFDFTTSNELEPIEGIIGQERALKALKLGVELIGLESDLVWVVSIGINKDKGFLAIYIPAIAAMKLPESIVFPISNLKSGQGIDIFNNNQKTTCKLGKRLHSTQLIYHYELAK